MKVYSSVATPPLPRADHFYSLDTDSFSVNIDPLNKASYNASAALAELGPLTISQISSNAAVIIRKGEHLYNHKNRYSLLYIRSGEMVISRNLETLNLQSGDFVLMDNIDSRSILVNDFVSLLIINVPTQTMLQYIPRPQDYTGLCVSTAKITQPCQFSAVISLWKQLQEGLLDQDLANVIADNVLKNIAKVYSSTCHPKGPDYSRRIRETIQLVHSNLGNPELTVELLADMMGVSSRYLRGLFAEREKLSHLILRLRLEECAEKLRNPLYRKVSITAIANRLGFNSSAHFSRVFKIKYGMSPREYRKQEQDSENIAN